MPINYFSFGCLIGTAIFYIQIKRQVARSASLNVAINDLKIKLNNLDKIPNDISNQRESFNQDKNFDHFQGPPNVINSENDILVKLFKESYNLKGVFILILKVVDFTKSDYYIEKINEKIINPFFKYFK